MSCHLGASVTGHAMTAQKTANRSVLFVSQIGWHFPRGIPFGSVLLGGPSAGQKDCRKECAGLEDTALSKLGSSF